MSKSVSKRFIVISAGIIMNTILAVGVLFADYATNGFPYTTINVLVPGFPAEAAGLQPGDRINRVNGKKTILTGEVQQAMRKAIADPSQPLEMEILRGGVPYVYRMTPKYDSESASYRLGFGYGHGEFAPGMFSRGDEGLGTRAGFGDTVRLAANTCVMYVRATFGALGMLITREADVGDLVGFVGIIDLIGDVYEGSLEVSTRAAFWNMMNLMSLLSINIAVFNLLPIPALDGGRMIFLIIEGIRRKPISPEREGMIHFAGFVLLMILAVFVTYNDILRLI